MTRDKLIQKLLDCDGDLDRLDAGERVAVGMDPELQKIAEASQQLWTDVRNDFRVQAPASFSFRVMEKVRAEADAKKVSWVDKLMRVFQPAPSFAMGMALLVVLALGFFFLNQQAPVEKIAHNPVIVTPTPTPQPPQVTPETTPATLRSQMFAAAGQAVPEEDVFSIAIGEELDYAADGRNVARITAHADSRLRVSEDRVELLSGEIDVDMYVKHRKPLVAFTRTTTVTIVGTEYILGVDEATGASTVTVLSGKVMVSTASGTTRYLTPGMQARVMADGSLDMAEAAPQVAPALAGVKEAPVEDAGNVKDPAEIPALVKNTEVEAITLTELEAEIARERSNAVQVKGSTEVLFDVVPVDDDAPVTDVNSLENRLQDGIR